MNFMLSGQCRSCLADLYDVCVILCASECVFVKLLPCSVSECQFCVVLSGLSVSVDVPELRLQLLAVHSAIYD